MTKDPTAYLRTESKRAWRESNETRDARALRGAIAYCRERGLFAAYDDEPKAKFAPVIEGLPWNPEAPTRITAFRVTVHVMGHWKDGQYRVRSPRGNHYTKGTWVSEHDAEIGRIPVPHWDYDGCDSAAREAWELADTHKHLGYAARHRLEDQDHSWEIEHEAANLEICCEEGNEWADPMIEREAFIAKYVPMAERPAIRTIRRLKLAA